MKADGWMKTCSKCRGEPQPVTNFGRNVCTADGYQAWCNSCMREASKKTVQRNRERNLARRADDEAGA